MPLIEIYVYDDGDACCPKELYSAVETADSMDPQDLQDALSEAFHSIEQDIWYEDNTQPPAGWDEDVDDPIGVGFLGEVVDFQVFQDLSAIVSHALADAGVRVLNAIGQPPFRLRDASSGYDRIDGYDRSADSGADLLPEFSD